MEIPKGPLLGAEPSDDEEGGDASLDAAKDVLEAIADKDAAALNLALKRHYETCEGDMSDEDDTEEE